MADPIFRLACVPAALQGDWASDLLAEGELALLAGAGGLDELTAVAHALDLVSVPLLRTEASAAEQERTVQAYAGSFPLVWIAAGFSDAASTWARDRGPMTLLVQADGPLAEDERKRVERFVGTLGRQAE
jgi:hypothetical protein